MVSAERILESLPKALKGIDLPDLGPKQSGKVRDFWVQGERRITVTTDRQSAFDRMLGHVPFKGTVLNQLAAWWFEQTKHIAPSHVISVPDPNALISHNCDMVPVEMVVRGYLSGVTNTAVWPSYQRGERMIYGLEFPDGMVKNQALSRPVITPTTHGGGPTGHDERLTRDEIIGRGIVERDLYEEMERVALKLFAFGSKVALEKGLILVDTKYEFGVHNDRLILIDEIHTPDSSRFWKADSYPDRMDAGEEPENFDKEFIRLRYAERGYRGEGDPPPMSDELVVAAAQRYIEAYEILSGEKFEPYEYPIEERIKENLRVVI